VGQVGVELPGLTTSRERRGSGEGGKRESVATRDHNLCGSHSRECFRKVLWGKRLKDKFTSAEIDSSDA
jgi:hypothetical protein